MFAFYGCTGLRSALFYGDVPLYLFDPSAFENTHPTFTIYYLAGRSG